MVVLRYGNMVNGVQLFMVVFARQAMRRKRIYIYFSMLISLPPNVTVCMYVYYQHACISARERNVCSVMHGMSLHV